MEIYQGPIILEKNVRHDAAMARPLGPQLTAISFSKKKKLSTKVLLITTASKEPSTIAY